MIPLCYAILDATTIVFAIDDKPKVAGRALRRLRNLAENERFALVVDHWDEDWTRLAYVLVEGVGMPLEDPDRTRVAVDALRERYPQYERMGLDASRHAIIELRVESVRRWSASRR